MTTPGNQGPETPQSGGTQGWGQAPAGSPSFPPPAGQPYGQQPTNGFPPPQGAPGQAFPPPAGGPQGFGAPGQPGQPMAGQPYPGQPPFGAQQPAKGGRGKKVLAGVAGAVVIAGIGTAVAGSGDPDVGDCIVQKGADSFDSIDCDDAAAQFRVVGIEDDEVSESTFNSTAADQYCGAFPAASVVLWYGTSGSDGKVYCAESV